MLEAIQGLDGAILMAIQGMRAAALNPLVEGYTALGNGGLLWIGLSLAMLCWRPARKAGALALLAMLLGLLCTNAVLKPLAARPRPWLDVAGLIPLVDEPDPNSFPSGHTCAAFAAGVTWMRTLPGKWMRALAAALAVCMGLSRLYVGVHYPTDVAAGALVGALCAWAALRLWSLFFQTKERSK